MPEVNGARFTAYFKLYDVDGVQFSFGCGSDDMAEQVVAVDAYVNRLKAVGYSATIPGLEPGEEEQDIIGFVLSTTLANNDPCVHLYVPWGDFRVATVYGERMQELGIDFTGMEYLSGESPEKEIAQRRGVFHELKPPITIIMEPSGKTNEKTGKPIMRYARVKHAASAPSPAPSPAEVIGDTGYVKGAKPTKGELSAFHAIGTQIYNEEWAEKRGPLVRFIVQKSAVKGKSTWFNDDDADSTSNLTSAQMRVLAQSLASKWLKQQEYPEGELKALVLTETDGAQDELQGLSTQKLYAIMKTAQDDILGWASRDAEEMPFE